MSKLEELIQQLCPDGVEFRELGKLASIETGTQLNKTMMTEIGNYPVLNGGINPSGYYNLYNTEVNTIAISQGGASAGYVNFMKTKFWAGAHCFVIKPTSSAIVNKFAFYLLKNDQDKLMNAKLGAGIPGLNKKELTRYQVPLIPLPIQQEIVSILDKFTQLEEELEEGLEARKRQYEYYRNHLLNFEGKDVEWKTLGEVLQPKGYIRGPFGSALRKEFFQKSGVPVYEQQHAIYNHRDFRYFIDTERSQKLKRFFVLPKDIIISCSGTIGKISIIQENDLKGIINQALLILRLDHTKIHSKFMQHYLESHPNLIISSAGGAISNIEKREVIEKIKIPNPPLSEQERIVSLLDKFDALVNDISVGLPAEIQARRKQYEYYRGKLLDFKDITNG